MRRLSTVVLLSLALLVSANAQETPAAPSFFGQAGLQLYSLRDLFKQDVPKALDQAKAFGITEVELAGMYNLSVPDYLKLLQDRALEPISGHYQYDRLTKDLPGVIAEAKALGLKFVACPWIPHKEAEFSEADARKAAADFNQWGEALNKESMIFAYHNHGYEFRPLADGTTLLDLMMRETKPEFVSFEMDVFWVMHPGQDPVKLLEKYPHRWALMHLKDIRKGAQVGIYTGHAPLTDDVPLGTGLVNWPAVLRAAAIAGVQHYFIEDESPTAVAAIPQSLKYLEGLKAK
jgi:sugar phosphate isomerase/epimerase